MSIVKIWKAIKAIVGILFLLCILIIGIAFFLPSDDKPKSYEKVNTIEMIRAYNANEARGDEIYKSKYIEFSGIVTNISSGLVSGATVTIDGDEFGMGGVDVDVSLPDAGKLNKGQRVTFKGQVTGRIMGEIQVTNGEIVDDK